MKLAQLAARPQLIQITLDDAEIQAQYGEALEFWTWDRQPIDVFMRMAANQETDPRAMMDVVRTLILDETGAPIIRDDLALPSAVLVKAMTRIVDTLGK